ncbi:hypothetical protein ACFSBZ_09625 [Amnibacterium flavum]|uniref:Uncharacterized protein n=1 Tax=Amnibacterium flavum TaxID=2173173 RepID=A0A2V1HRC1_9MICO|nr:hypothetical protein [Amnibacterium flavum]PVZ95115.1 hypothetical protein DDQ50_00860 [Amnibacterium flavum]
MTAPVLDRPRAAARYRRGIDQSALAEAPARPARLRGLDDTAYAPSSTGPDVPVRTRTTGRRRFSPARLTLRLVIAVVAIAATFSGIVVFTTNAYFTSQGLVQTNAVNPGTIALNTAPSFTLANLVPLSSTTATSVSTGSIVNFDVASASLDTRGTVAVTNVTDNASGALLPWVRVAIYDGSNWTTVVAANASPKTAEFTMAANTTRSMKLRFYLDSAAPDALQGKAITFTITTRGIQSGADAGTAY